MGDRLSQTVNGMGTRYALDPAAGLSQVLSDGTSTYLYGIGRIAQQGTNLQYFGSDALGSVRQLYDSSGQILASIRYDPYGTVLSQDGAATSIYGFTGEQLDASTGLEYLRARYYSAYLNQWIQPDPIISDYANPQSLNRYTYVLNNPVRYTDPSGQCPLCALFWSLWETVSPTTATGAGGDLYDPRTGEPCDPMTGCVSPSASDLETAGTVTRDVVVGEVTGRGVAKLGGWVAGKVAGPLTSILGRCADNTVVRALTGQVAKQAAQNLPRITRAVAPVEKFSKYIFRPGGAEGHEVAYIRLGYTIEDSAALAKTLEEQALTKFQRGEWTYGVLDEWGQRIDIVFDLHGKGDLAGKVSRIVTGWMLREDGSITLNTPFSGFAK